MTHIAAAVVRRFAGLAIVVAAGSLALTGCGSGDGTDTSPASSSDGSTASESSPTSRETVDPNDAYRLDLPEGVQLTALGTDLGLGDTARVAWQPDTKKVGVIAITVTKLRKGTLKDFAGFTLDERTRQSTPYYVDAKVKNIGRSDLSAVATPLYLVDGNDLLVEASTFQGTFKPCAAKPLPEKFVAGQSAEVCLVYIAADRGTLEAVSFRPTEEYAPIRWTGALARPSTDGSRSNENG